MTAFLALLRRDLLVGWRHALPLLAATLTQPILVVLVFGNILPRLGLVADQFRTVMVPGLMSITMLMAGVQGVLMPLVDRPVGQPRGGRAAAVAAVRDGRGGREDRGRSDPRGARRPLALPAMMLLMHQVAGVAVRPNWLALAPMIVLCGLLSAAFGMTIGSTSQPRFSGLLFAVILGPMMLFGCAYYPYQSLSVLGPFQYVFLLNPLVFMSEAMRLSVTPNVPHMPLPLLLAGLCGCTLGFGWLGARTFERRTIL